MAIKSIIQIVNSENGTRSQPFLSDPSQLQNTVERLYEQDYEIDLDWYVLILGTYDEDSEEEKIDWATDPLFTIRSLMESFDAEGTDRKAASN
jgi:hypothetical protein